MKSKTEASFNRYGACESQAQRLEALKHEISQRTGEIILQSQETVTTKIITILAFKQPMMKNFIRKISALGHKSKVSPLTTYSTTSPSAADLMWIHDMIDNPNYPDSGLYQQSNTLITTFTGYIRVRFGSRATIAPTVQTSASAFQILESISSPYLANAPTMSVLAGSHVPACNNVVRNTDFGTITIHVYCLDKHLSISIDRNASTTELCNLMYGWANKNMNIHDGAYTFIFKYGMSCIVPDRKISDYAISNGARINVIICALHGGAQETQQLLLPTYSHVLNCEMQLLNDFQLQSADEIVPGFNYKEILDKLNNMLPYVSIAQKDTIMWLTSQFEKLVSVSYWYKKCDSYADYTMLTLTAYQTFTGKSATKEFINRSIIFNLQSDGDVGEVLKSLRKGFDGVEHAKENPFTKRIVNIYSYLLVHGFLERFGFSLNDDDYSRMEKKMYLTSYSSKKEMFLCVCETTLFICEKLFEYKVTGDINMWGNDSTNYESWFSITDKLISLAPYTSNLTPHGMSYFEFISELKDSIEKGNTYTRFIEKNNGYTYALMHKKLLSLKMIESTELTRRSAMKERKAPFGVLVHGTSSVAKSTFSKMLYYYYAALHNLGSEDHYRYVRNPADEYWSNFDTSKWCVQLDDIAFLHPGKSSEADPTLMELLNVVNNVPYVPPQAALEDKGRTPVLAQLVVATSNAADLNAHEYFWCPLAIRRRLPYVIEVRPKQQYIHENGRFIDPVKLDPINGDFPDYWIITVSKIIPFFDGQRDLAKLEVVEEFDDINKFLKHFGAASLAHLANQDKSDICDKEMKKLHVCPICLMVTKYCECNVELQSKSDEFFFWRIYTALVGIITGSWWKFWMAMAACDYFITFNIYMGRYKIIRYVTTRFLSKYYTRTKFLQIQSSFARNICDNKQWLLFVATLGLVVVFFKCTFSATNPIKDEDDEPNTDNSEYTMQSENDRFEALKSKVEREEKANVWFNSTLETATFEVPHSSLCMQSLEPTGIRDLFSKNIVHLNVRYKRLGLPKISSTGGIILTNNIILLNNHTLPIDIEEYEIEIVTELTITGVNGNLRMRLNNKEIVRDFTCDVALFKANSLPPRKSIMKYWGESHGNISRALVLQRSSVGTCAHQIERAVTAFPDMYLDALERSLDAYMAQSQTVTKAGDCGSMLINHGPRGPVIVGMHTFGSGFLAGFVHLRKTNLEKLILLLNEQCILPFNVQGSFGPDLKINGAEIPIVSLHHRSVFRYIEKGTANVYGSLNLPRAMPKSSVCDTILSEEMKQHFNVVNNYGQPAMSGWEPWRKNVVEMVQPPVIMDTSILKHCVNEFTKDILASLPLGWKEDLFFLNKLESVNGIPGVMFIDRINVSSSMGFPWNTSKKKFVHSTNNPNNMDEITFSDDVWQRYDAIIGRYECGERAFPVFTGHLKDEATALEKIAIKKTRLFTGAPIDWSLVVRSRLLSFVRLVQKNKFIFEAGPGTVCQSTEWGNIHDYLTKHGDDRIVAGDYGKYDKRMIADIILASFEIIINIHREAGFSEAELLQIAAIGYDISFSVVNLHGDLVGFFGTEPSGHPLTVIVNSLVNSLYMRYSYTILNPEQTCSTFKRNVNLFTYGDDNIMGISVNAPWFNHTSIQHIMSTIGVEYTMADKKTLSKPYCNLQECNFLKRTWIWNTEVGAYLCPLEVDSVYKSLMIGVPSKTICPEEQMVNIISSANVEFFFHGREFFEKHYSFFGEILDRVEFKPYVNSTTLPDWLSLKDRFWRASEQIASRR